MKHHECIELHVKVLFKIKFWDALKMRIAGKAYQDLTQEIVRKLQEDNPEVATCQ